MEDMAQPFGVFFTSFGIIYKWYGWMDKMRELALGIVGSFLLVSTALVICCPRTCIAYQGGDGRGLKYQLSLYHIGRVSLPRSSMHFVGQPGKPA